MVVKQVRDGRFWCVDFFGQKSEFGEVIFSKDASRIVIKLESVTVVVENKSEKELNNEQ